MYGDIAALVDPGKVMDRLRDEEVHVIRYFLLSGRKG